MVKQLEHYNSHRIPSDIRNNKYPKNQEQDKANKPQ
jgi:hypothetical protein